MTLQWRILSVLRVFVLAVCVCGECDTGEGETCTQQFDSATLLQVRAHKSFGDEVETTIVAETRRRKREEKRKERKEKREQKKEERKEHREQKKEEKEEKREKKKEEKKKEKEEKENAELAKAKATYWPTPIPINRSGSCSMGSDGGSITDGVHRNGSFNLEIMMKELVSKANEAVGCLQRETSAQTEYREKSRHNFRNSKHYIRHHGGKRPERRLEEKQAREVWKKAKCLRKKYRHELMKAKFKAKILPKVVKMLAPVIHKEVGNANLKLNYLVHEGAQSVSNLAAKGIQKIDWLEYIIRSKVSAAIDKEIKRIVPPMMKKVWSVAGDAEQAISGALVSSLGEIPFVGGILAEAANMGVTMAYNRAKEGVNTAITNLFEHIANETTNAIVNEACKPLEKVKAGIEQIENVVITGADKLESAGNAVANALGNATQTEYKSQADAAEKASAGVQDSILSDGHDSSNEDQSTKTQWEKEDGDIIGTTPVPPTTTGW